MDPVARVGDVLDVGVGEQPVDLWVILRAGDTERKPLEPNGPPERLAP